MAGNVFQAIITVLDQATAPMRAIDAEAVRLSMPLRQVGQRVAELGEAAGLGKLAEAGRRAGERFKELGSQVRDVLGPLEALGAAAGLAGLGEAVKSAAEYGANLYDTAQKIGIASDQLAKWRFAATLAGTDTESLDKGLEYLNRTIGEALSGRSQQMALMFSRLGISLRDGTGHARDASVVMGDLADAVKKNQNSPVILAQIAQAMGMRSGAELLPLLRQGREGLADTAAEATKYGLVMSDAATRSAKAFDDSYKKMGFALQGLANAVGEQLFPVLQPMLQGMADWIAANRVILGQKVKDFVTGVGDAVGRVDWAGIVAGFEGFGHALDAVGSFLGPIGSAVALAAVAFSPFIAATLSAGGSLVALGATMATVAARIGLMAFAPVIAGIGNFVTALRAGYGAMAAFNLVLDANPIGVAVAAIGLLAGAAFLVYKNWTPISAFFKTLWADLVALFNDGWEKLRPIVEPLLKAGSELAHLLGFSSDNPSSPDAAAGGPMPAAPQPPRPYANAAGNAASPAGAPGGKHELTVRFQNAPPGTSVSSRSSGNAARPDVDVGYGFAPAM